MKSLLLPFAIIAVFMNTGQGNNLSDAVSAYSGMITATDTIPIPGSDQVQSLGDQVIISSDSNSLEITPVASGHDGVLIEPVNNVTNEGLSTSFYIKDNHAWLFYTNSSRQLTIDGQGAVHAHGRLMVNGAERDGVSAFRVRGQGRFDSALYIRAADDTASFVSIERNVKFVTEPDDSISAYTTTPITWANGQNIAAFRLRHPSNVLGVNSENTSIQRDFLILPYQYGTAIEYNGVVECWVGEWSIHKGLYYYDVEGQGNGWGGVSWVGDDIDAGGLRATARNNTSLGGNVAYGEMSVEKFNAQPNGDLRLRLPSTENNFHFVYGGRGSTNIIAKMKNEGLVIPKMSSTGNITNPETAQIVFDSTESRFKGYNGTAWVNFNEEEKLVTGSFGNGGNGADTVYAIPHGLGVIPVYYQVTATSRDAGNISYVTADVNFLNVYYSVPPPAGINNLTWNWQVKK